MDRVEVVKEVYRRLKEVFPTPYRPGRTPIEQAVFTVLSQNTTDRNAERCLDNLKKVTGGNLLKLAELPESTLISAIRPCGMFRQKVKGLKALVSKWPEIEERLRELPPEKGIELLTSLPFVGSKTARVILTFAFNKNTFPIDTHCYRVLKRLGIFPENWDKDRISEFMESHFDGEFNRELHYNLIRLGRTICKARNPNCDKCPLRELCLYYRNRKRGEEGAPTPSQP